MKKEAFSNAYWRNFHFKKLIGAFILFGSLMMILGATALMFDSWDTMKNFPDCIKKANQTNDAVLAQLKYTDCKTSLHDITGAQLKGGQTRLTTRQFWTGLLWPIANLFFWAVAFMIGLMLYSRNGCCCGAHEYHKRK